MNGFMRRLLERLDGTLVSDQGNPIPSQRTSPEGPAARVWPCGDICDFTSCSDCPLIDLRAHKDAS